MKKNSYKIFEDLCFLDVKTFNIYKLLKTKKEEGLISNFEFYSHIVDENIIHNIITAEKIVIDEFVFENPVNSTSELRNDLNFFFFLMEYKKNNVITTFELPKYTSSSSRKYNAKKTIVDGNLFDSRQEVFYYISLLIRKNNGEIKNFSLKPKFVLIDKFKKFNPFTGTEKSFSASNYIADFEVLHNNGFIEIVDVKGVLTDVFVLKQRMFEAFYPHLYLNPVKQKSSNSLEFINIDEYNKALKKRKKDKKLAQKL